MSARVVLILVCVLLIGDVLRAEPDTLYELYTPTADEYLGALPAILAQSGLDYGIAPAGKALPAVVQLGWTQLTIEYGPLETHAYGDLAAIYPYYNDYLTHVQDINPALLEAWLRDNPVNLDDYDAEHTLNFGDNIIKVTPRDFNADGEHEWSLDVEQNRTYARKEAVKRTSTGQYELIDTPVPWFGCCSFLVGGMAKELAFADLNQDGLPEWVLAVGGYGASGTNGGYIQILQWDNGRLSELTEDFLINYSSPAGGGPAPLFPYGVTVTLEDVDANGTIDIQVQQEKYDNWRCTWTQTQVYGWRDDAYALISEPHREDEVKGCAWRAAEAAMWSSDYDTAVSEYERALTLPFAEEFTSPYDEEYTNDVWGYEQTRMALAYALGNRSLEAQSILRNLQDVGIRSEAVQQMSNILSQQIDHTTSADLCQAVYDLWFNYVDVPPEMWETDAMLNLIPMRAIVGDTYAFELPWSPIPYPEKAGCDVTHYGRSLSESRYKQAGEDFYARFYRPSAEGHLSYHQSIFVDAYQIIRTFNGQDKRVFLKWARFFLMQAQQDHSGDEWAARYLFATALRENDHLEEALAQYVYIYENSSRESWRQLAGLYLRPIESK